MQHAEVGPRSQEENRSDPRPFVALSCYLIYARAVRCRRKKAARPFHASMALFTRADRGLLVPQAG
jgi:hypothetical protein